MLLDWLADWIGAPHLVPHDLSHSVHGADAGADFLMLGARGTGHVGATSFLAVPKMHRLATKAVDKAAWFHDAVVDFQETDLFWQARRFARRHLVAETFGLGVAAGTVLLLTAPTPKKRPKARPDPREAGLAELRARRAGHAPPRRTASLPRVPRAPAAVEMRRPRKAAADDMLDFEEDPGSEEGEVSSTPKAARAVSSSPAA
ncbi:unnamed protein product [Effrenium voratum]|nr:unnamed protein product [Effrenium voratum]